MEHALGLPPKSKSKQRLNLDSSDICDITHITDSNLQYKAPLLESLDLNLFKTKLCANLNPHNYKICFYYHNNKDRRRNEFNYKPDLCEIIEKGKECSKGDLCNKAHNYIEVLYHPDKYKTKFCSLYPVNINNCEYANYCSFAHSEPEIVIDLIHNLEFDEDFFIFHYKTVWCPFNLSQHNKALCIYAHNWQDFRRKPDNYNYSPITCSKWNNNDFVKNYNESCNDLFQCKFSHGWKESEFHPLKYKTKSCNLGKPCSKGKDCPFFHQISEQRLKIIIIIYLIFRILPNWIENNYFSYIPRNRIVTNTFKNKRTYSILSTNSNPFIPSSSFNFAKRDSKEPFSLTKSTMSTDNLDIELDFSKKMDLFENENDEKRRGSGHPFQKKLLKMELSVPLISYQEKDNIIEKKLELNEESEENQDHNKLFLVERVIE